MASLNSFGTRQTLPGTNHVFYNLTALEKNGFAAVSQLPATIKIILESLLRSENGHDITKAHIESVARWSGKTKSQDELPFKPSRVVLQDFSGVPCLVDFAAMRTAMKQAGGDPKKIEPIIPTDLVIDHSIQVDYAGSSDALDRNMKLEAERNNERYAFMKWGQAAFKKLRVVPPGVGIIHQVNLEYLAQGVCTEQEGNTSVVYPDSCVGTDSHTTMINGLGIVGWGVGGIEAEAVMLGQPIYLLMPEVIGVRVTGTVRAGVTATDIALYVTQLLRKKKVVEKFVEFFGAGLSALNLPDRATIANMCPEYGATMGFFPSDDETLKYLRKTGRSSEQVTLVEQYLKAQGLFRTSSTPDADYTDVVELNLGDVVPSLAGPKRPQDRVNVSDMKHSFTQALSKPTAENGYALAANQLGAKSAIEGTGVEIGHGAVVIAAITSCTNTSNPSVMLGAGILAKKAVELGLTVPAYVKTSMAPGSRVVHEYLKKAGLMPALEQLGFHTVGFGCTTCIGNSGPLRDEVIKAVEGGNIVAAAVLSGNRNFEGRISPQAKANYLASPPLVVAFAIAGRVDIDLETEPLGTGKNGKPVYLKDIWPTTADLAQCEEAAASPELFKSVYENINRFSDAWANLKVDASDIYPWDAASTYIQNPPFFEGFSMNIKTLKPIVGAKILAVLGDSVTTDHISPAGNIAKNSPAGKYLIENGVAVADFNSYGARRGNDRVMVRGTFANIRLKNRMLDGAEGGDTLLLPEKQKMSIYDAAVAYKQRGIALVIVAGKEYGTGSSRDWAAKGSNLMGVKAVLAESYERIHRSNLVGMGVLPLQFKDGESAASRGITGFEQVAIGLEDSVEPLQDIVVTVDHVDGTTSRFAMTCRLDTPVEVAYFKQGGILPATLRSMLK